jgi:hypothetical protein
VLLGMDHDRFTEYHPDLTFFPENSRPVVDLRSGL